MAAVAIATAMTEIGTAEATPRIEGPDGIEARGENSDRRFMVGVWLYLEGTKTEGVLLTIIAALALVALTVTLQWCRGSRTEVRRSMAPEPLADEPGTQQHNVGNESEGDAGRASMAPTADPEVRVVRQERGTPPPTNERAERDEGVIRRGVADPLVPALHRSKHTPHVEQWRLHNCLEHESRLKPGRNQHGSYLTCTACRLHCYWVQVPTQGEYARQDERTRRLYRIMASTWVKILGDGHPETNFWKKASRIGEAANPGPAGMKWADMEDEEPNVVHGYAATAAFMVSDAEASDTSVGSMCAAVVEGGESPTEPPTGLSEGEDAQDDRDASKQRARAESRASELLALAAKEGRTITLKELEEAFMMWRGHNNPHRKKVMPQGWTTIQSDTFGLVRRQDTREAYVSRVTTKYPSLTRLANEWFRANRSDACPGWTSITVNVNLEAAKHRDTNNAGPSALVSLGDFKGGDLFVWRNDDRKQPLSSLPRSQSEILDTKREIAYFDGTKAHQTGITTGNRVSLVFYTHTSHRAAGKGTKAELTKLGFCMPLARRKRTAAGREGVPTFPTFEKYRQESMKALKASGDPTDKKASVAPVRENKTRNTQETHA